VGGELDHAEHERDRSRIVDARLPLQRRPRPTGHFAPAKHREHDGRIRGRNGRSDDSGQNPVEAQRVVADQRDESSCPERAENPKGEDRRSGRTEAPPANVDAAIEENDDQSNHRDPLDRPDRHRLVHARPDIRDRRGAEQKERRRRHRNTLGQLRRQDGEREARCNEENDAGEVADLGHGSKTPTRLPGSPTKTLTGS
jgi:hypothetical protein